MTTSTAPIITGPYLRDAGKGRSSKMQWVANVRRGCRLDIVVLAPQQDRDSGTEVPACEAAEMLASLTAVIESTGKLPEATPTPPATDAIANLMADVLKGGDDQ